MIGDYAFIANGVVFADSFAALPPEARSFRERDRGPRRGLWIGDDVWIGARVGGAKIGDGAVIGAGAVIEAEVPDRAVVAGNPARIVGWARPGTGARSTAS
ncbi:MAG: hexapeptide repeat-containing transferase [Solirubrobacterales bacterium]|nr:hexapeptide repeat-containing transferase [Solirubrobacterales bacterium]